MTPLRREDRQAAQALDAAEAGGALEHLEAVEEPGGPFVASSHVDADHAAEAAHLPLRDVVIRMLRQPRVINFFDARVPRQPLRQSRSVRILPFHPYRKGFQPSPQDRKSTRLNSSHSQISYAVFCLKK